MAEQLRGGCRCGALRYHIDVSGPMGFYACHCHQCQRLLGSAFALNLPVLREAVTTQGDVARTDYASSPEHGNRLYTCPTCLSQVFYANSWRRGVLGVRAGSIDDLDRCEMLGHIWTGSRQTWVSIDDDRPRFEGQPSEEDWRALFGTRNAIFT
jgi:hypothetical protein